MRLPLLLAAALSLAACGGPVGTTASPGSSPASSAPAATPAPPAPLAATNIDDKAITVAFQALDVAAYGADALLDSGRIKPGSPAALKIANGLETARDWLNIASKAQQAGQARSYAEAIEKVSAALGMAQTAILNPGAK